MNESHWIFISPHFDDAVLSCGALIWDLAQQGQAIEVWTIMGGFPTDEDYSDFARQTHQTWGRTGREAIEMRRGEDKAACAILGAQPRHLDWPDVIYRHDPHTGGPMVNNNAELFGKPPEEELITKVATYLEGALPKEARVVFPFGLGTHIDHRAVVSAGAALAGVDHYYADYPYILTAFDDPRVVAGHYQPIPRPFGPGALEAWQDAVLCYESQLSGFWRDETEARLALRNYLAGGGGRLWQRKTPA